jgi:hypothetical protein
VRRNRHKPASKQGNVWLAKPGFFELQGEHCVLATASLTRAVSKKLLLRLEV